MDNEKLNQGLKMNEETEALLGKVAEWLEDYCPKHNTTDLGWVIIPEVAKERYKQDASQLLSICKEAGLKFVVDIDKDFDWADVKEIDNE